MKGKTIGIIAGLGELPALGARAARERGWDVVVVSVTHERDEDLAAYAVSYHDISLGDYGRVVAVLTDAGVHDVYVLGRLPKTLIHGGALDDSAMRVLSRLGERGDHALIEAFVNDMAARGLVVRSQLDLLGHCVVPAGFSVGPTPSPEEWRDVRHGYKVACWLTDRIDAGQTVVVKKGMVLALEAAEGTDETIRRGGRLGGPGTVVVKVKGARDDAHDLPVIGPATVAAMVDAGASVLAFEAGRTLLLDRDKIVSRAREKGIALIAVEGNGET